MRVWITIAVVVSAMIAACDDQGPAEKVVVLPEVIGPASDVLELWAEPRLTRVPIADSLLVDIHLRNSNAAPVEVTAGCRPYMYITAFYGSQELGFDGSGRCLEIIEVHRFEPNEEVVITVRAWARSNSTPFARGVYTIRVGNYVFDGIPEPEAEFTVE